MPFEWIKRHELKCTPLKITDSRNTHLKLFWAFKNRIFYWLNRFRISQRKMFEKMFEYVRNQPSIKIFPYLYPYYMAIYFF